ncbi:MAG: glycosyltransferase family 4 protein, partial [Pseudomonadota bacterium]
FVFTDPVRFLCAERAPELVLAWARHSMARPLQAVLEEARVDAVVAHGLFPWSGLLGHVAGKNGIPVGVIEHSAADIFRLRTDNRLRRVYSKRAKELDVLMAVGPGMVECLRDELGLPRARLIVNGVDTRFNTPTSARPESWRGRFVVLCAANYYRRKGIEELLTAFRHLAARHPRAMLCVVSSLPADVVDDVGDLVDSGHVVVERPMDPVTLRGLMAAADVFAMPSWDEAFGLVYSESLSVGTPVIFSSDSGFYQYLMAAGVSVGQVGWCVEPRNTSRLVEALLAAHDQLSNGGESVSTVGPQLVSQHFSWTANAQALLDALLD